MDTKYYFCKLVARLETTGASNYDAWKFKLNLLLRSKELDKIVNGVNTKPFETDGNYNDWIKKDTEAQTIIGLNVEEEIALKISTCTSSAQMIQRLEALYATRPTASLDSLRA